MNDFNTDSTKFGYLDIIMYMKLPNIGVITKLVQTNS